MKDFDRLLRLWAKRRFAGATFESIAAEYGPPVTRAHIYHWLKTRREPEKIGLRLALGLPAYKLAPACSDCGEVHTTRRCTKKTRKPYADLTAIPTNLLRWMIEHRGEV